MPTFPVDSSGESHTQPQKTKVTEVIVLDSSSDEDEEHQVPESIQGFASRNVHRHGSRVLCKYKRLQFRSPAVVNNKWKLKSAKKYTDEEEIAIYNWTPDPKILAKRRFERAMAAEEAKFLDNELAALQEDRRRQLECLRLMSQPGGACLSSVLSNNDHQDEIVNDQQGRPAPPLNLLNPYSEEIPSSPCVTRTACAPPLVPIQQNSATNNPTILSEPPVRHSPAPLLIPTSSNLPQHLRWSVEDSVTSSTVTPPFTQPNLPANYVNTTSTSNQPSVLNAHAPPRSSCVPNHQSVPSTLNMPALVQAQPIMLARNRDMSISSNQPQVISHSRPSSSVTHQSVPITRMPALVQAQPIMLARNRDMSISSNQPQVISHSRPSSSVTHQSVPSTLNMPALVQAQPIMLARNRDMSISSNQPQVISHSRPSSSVTHQSVPSTRKMPALVQAQPVMLARNRDMSMSSNQPQVISHSRPSSSVTHQSVPITRKMPALVKAQPVMLARNRDMSMSSNQPQVISHSRPSSSVTHQSVPITRKMPALVQAQPILPARNRDMYSSPYQPEVIPHSKPSSLVTRQKIPPLVRALPNLPANNLTMQPMGTSVTVPPSAQRQDWSSENQTMSRSSMGTIVTVPPSAERQDWSSENQTMSHSAREPMEASAPLVQTRPVDFNSNISTRDDTSSMPPPLMLIQPSTLVPENVLMTCISKMSQTTNSSTIPEKETTTTAVVQEEMYDPEFPTDEDHDSTSGAGQSTAEIQKNKQPIPGAKKYPNLIVRPASKSLLVPQQTEFDSNYSFIPSANGNKTKRLPNNRPRPSPFEQPAVISGIKRSVPARIPAASKSKNQVDTSGNMRFSHPPPRSGTATKSSSATATVTVPFLTLVKKLPQLPASFVLKPTLKTTSQSCTTSVSETVTSGNCSSTSVIPENNQKSVSFGETSNKTSVAILASNRDPRLANQRLSFAEVSQLSSVQQQQQQSNKQDSEKISSQDQNKNKKEVNNMNKNEKDTNKKEQVKRNNINKKTELNQTKETLKENNLKNKKSPSKGVEFQQTSSHKTTSKQISSPTKHHNKNKNSVSQEKSTEDGHASVQFMDDVEEGSTARTDEENIQVHSSQAEYLLSLTDFGLPDVGVQIDQIEEVDLSSYGPSTSQEETSVSSVDKDVNESLVERELSLSSKQVTDRPSLKRKSTSSPTPKGTKKCSVDLTRNNVCLLKNYKNNENQENARKLSTKNNNCFNKYCKKADPKTVILNKHGKWVPVSQCKTVPSGENKKVASKKSDSLTDTLDGSLIMEASQNYTVPESENLELDDTSSFDFRTPQSTKTKNVSQNVRVPARQNLEPDESSSFDFPTPQSTKTKNVSQNVRVPARQNLEPDESSSFDFPTPQSTKTKNVSQNVRVPARQNLELADTSSFDFLTPQSTKTKNVSQNVDLDETSSVDFIGASSEPSLSMQKRRLPSTSAATREADWKIVSPSDSNNSSDENNKNTSLKIVLKNSAAKTSQKPSSNKKTETNKQQKGRDEFGEKMPKSTTWRTMTNAQQKKSGKSANGLTAHQNTAVNKCLVLSKYVPQTPISVRKKRAVTSGKRGVNNDSSMYNSPSLQHAEQSTSNPMCPVCHRFSLKTSKYRLKWIKCTVCKRRFHEKCTDFKAFCNECYHEDMKRAQE